MGRSGAIIALYVAQMVENQRVDGKIVSRRVSIITRRLFAIKPDATRLEDLLAELVELRGDL